MRAAALRAESSVVVTRLVVVILLVPFAAGAQVTCGGTVGAKQKVTLTANVGPCDGVDAAIVVDSGSLDLAGFAVSCSDLDGDGILPQGIVLTGRKSKVMGGTVIGCANGVGLAGQGKHVVQGMTVQNSGDDGVDVLAQAEKNRIVGTTSSNNGDDGFYLRSSKNKVADNVSTGNGADGFDLPTSAGKNKLMRNRADGNEDSGIEVSGSKNKLLLSSTGQNGVDGIHVGGSGNTVRGGTSMGNGVYDIEGCAANKVKKLSFGTASPDCR